VRRLLILLIALPLFAAGHDITPPTYGISPYFASDPVVASNGDGFLTLWSAYLPNAGPFVYGSIADAHGKTVTPKALIVTAQATVLQVFPSGHDYVALLMDRWGAYRVARIAADGRLLSLSGGARSSMSGSRSRIAFDGSHFFLVADSFPNIVAITVDMNGSVSERIIVPGVYSTRGLDVTYAGNAFFVTWSDAGGVYLQRFQADGSPIAPKVVLANQTAGAVAVASNGNNVGIVEGTNPLSAAIVGLDGAILAQSRGPEATTPLALTWNGTAYVTTGQTYALRIDERAVFLDPPVAISAARNAASNGKLVYAVSPNVNGYPGVFGVAIDTTNGIKASDPATLSVMLRRQQVAGLASDGVGFLSTWIDQPSGSERHESTMYLSPDGIPLDPQQTDLDADTLSANTSVAFGASVYLVAWQRGGDVVARRVRPGTGSLDAEAIVVAPNASIGDRSVAWDGHRFIVVSFVGGSAYASFVDEQGGVTAPAKVRNPNITGTTAQVAWDGKHYLLASTIYGGTICTCPSVPVGAEVTQFNQDGSVLVSISIPSAPRFHIASSGHGDALLVVDKTYPSIVDAYRIHDDAEKLSLDTPVRLFNAFGPIASDVTWNGTSYTVAWHTGFDNSWWLSTVTVFPQTVINQRTVFVGPPDSSAYVAVAANANGSAVMTLTEVPMDAGIARVRAYAERELANTPPAPATPRLKSVEPAGGSAITITWESDGANVAGFIIDSVGSTGAPSTIWTANGGARSVTLGKVPFVRIRAFGPGGTSEPSSTVSTSPTRRRTIGH
jgi:hypothetical protein